jgi:hypothetical protein
MTTPNAQLDQMLNALDESIPSLVRNNPAPDAFWSSFIRAADAIQDQATPAERSWVCDRLDAIQVKHHLVPPADQI